MTNQPRLNRLIMRWIAEAIATTPKGSTAQASYLLTHCFYNYYAHLKIDQRQNLIAHLQALHVLNDQELLQSITNYYGTRYAQALRTFIHVIYSLKEQPHFTLKYLQNHLSNYILFDSEHTLSSPVYHGLKRALYKLLMTEQVPKFDRLQANYWPQIEHFNLIDILDREYVTSTFLGKYKNEKQKSDLYKNTLLQIMVGNLKEIDFFQQHFTTLSEWQDASLVPIVDYGFIEGFTPLFWVATPYIQQTTLQDFIDHSCDIITIHDIVLRILNTVAQLHTENKAHGALQADLCYIDEQYQIKIKHAALSIFISKITGVVATETKQCLQLKSWLSYDLKIDNLQDFTTHQDKLQTLDTYKLLLIIHELYTGQEAYYNHDRKHFQYHSSLPSFIQKIFDKYFSTSPHQAITAVDLSKDLQPYLKTQLQSHQKKLRYRCWKSLFKSRDLLAFVHQNKGNDVEELEGAKKQRLQAEFFLHFTPQLQLFDLSSLNQIIVRLNQVEKIRYRQQLEIKDLTDKASTYENLAAGIAQEMITRLNDMSGENIYESLDEITELKARYLQAARDKVTEETNQLNVAKSKHMQLIHQLKQLHKDLLKKQVQKFKSNTRKKSQLSSKELKFSQDISPVPEKKSTENDQVENDQVENDQVENNQVENDQVENDQVENDQVENNQVENNQVENNQVENNQVENDQVENDQVENDQVENDQVENNQVENDQVENDQVENDQVENNQVENDQVENDQVENDQVENNQVENDQVDLLITSHMNQKDDLDQSNHEDRSALIKNQYEAINEAPKEAINEAPKEASSEDLNKNLEILVKEVDEQPLSKETNRTGLERTHAKTIRDRIKKRILSNRSKKTQLEDTPITQIEDKSTLLLPVNHLPIDKIYSEPINDVTNSFTMNLHKTIGEVNSLRLPKDIDSSWYYCPPGEFYMGSVKHEGDKDEKPRHQVRLTHGFWLSQTPITQQQWYAVMGYNPSQYQGDYYPVERINWLECIEFCNRLSEYYKLDTAYQINEDLSVIWNQYANGYRLPTEAEWEYAAKAGEESHFSGSLRLRDVAWYVNNSEQSVKEVGLLKANIFGLKDMSGLVWEWCHDLWDSNAYIHRKTLVEDPCIYDTKGNRVFRGGSWKSSSYECRVTCRSGFEPSIRWAYRGFRVCLPDHTSNFQA